MNSRSGLVGLGVSKSALLLFKFDSRSYFLVLLALNARVLDWLLWWELFAESRDSKSRLPSGPIIVATGAFVASNVVVAASPGRSDALYLERKSLKFVRAHAMYGNYDRAYC